MKHLVLLITIVLALTSCAKPHWVQTNNGKYIYGIFNDKDNLIWEGPSNAVLADGKGVLLAYDDQGQLKESINISTKLGVISDYSYVITEVGSYLGKKKKGLPNGFGVLIDGNTASIGHFKKRSFV